MRQNGTHMKTDRKERSPRQALKRKVKMLAIVTVVSLLIAFTAVIASVFFWLYDENQGKAAVEFEKSAETSLNAGSGSVYTQAEVDALVSTAKKKAMEEATARLLGNIQNTLEKNSDAMGMIRGLFPQKIVVYSSNKYYFLPIDSSLKADAYQDENFKQDEKGYLSYSENGKLISHMGVDVSKFQGDIDWTALKNAGVEYAIVRVGLRGYGTGKIVVDDHCDNNIKNALASGMKVGVYFYSAAISEAEAEEEAQCVLDQIKGYQISYPVYLDIEESTSENDRTKSLTAADHTAIAKAFLKKIKDAGYQPAIYGNLKTFTLMLDLKQLEDYPKWLASYSLPIYYPYAYEAIQYTENGTINGIKGAVDLNISFKDYGSGQ